MIYLSCWDHLKKNYISILLYLLFFDIWAILKKYYNWYQNIISLINLNT
jgi:hypothetical protein